MKRFLTVLCLFTIAISLYPQTNGVNEHKQTFVNNIRFGRYEQALQNMNNIEFWDYSGEDILSLLDAQFFTDFLKQNNVPKQLQDSFNLYFARTLTSEAEQEFDNANFQISLDYLLTSTKIKYDILGTQSSEYIENLFDIGYTYAYLEDYNNAEKYLQEALTLCQKVLGKHHTYYAYTLEMLGYVYMLMNDYNKSEQFYLKSLDACKHIKENSIQNQIFVRLRLAQLYLLTQDVIQADKYYSIIIQDINKVEDWTDTDIVPLYTLIAKFYQYWKNDYNLAKQYYIMALEAYEKTLNKNEFQYVDILTNLGHTYFYLNEIELAEKSFLQSLAITKQIYDSIYYADALYSMSTFYYEINQLDKAELYCDTTAQIIIQLTNQEQNELAIALTNIGINYSTINSIEKAENYYLQALKIFQTIDNPNSLAYANLLSSLASINNYIFDLQTAQYYSNQAQNIFDHLNKELNDKFIYSNSLYNHGFIYHNLGEYENAEKYLLMAMNICEIVKDSLDNIQTNSFQQDNTIGLYQITPNIYNVNVLYANILMQLGYTYWNELNFKEAEIYYTQTLEHLKQLGREQHSNYAFVLLKMADVYFSSGNLAKTEEYLYQAIHILKYRKDNVDFDYSELLKYLSIFYINVGDFNKADELAYQSLGITKEIYGEQSLEYATSLSIVGIVFYNKGLYEQAADYFLQALHIQYNQWGEIDIRNLELLAALGETYCHLGQFALVEFYYCTRINQIVEQYSEIKQYPVYAQALKTLGLVSSAKQDYQKAEEYFYQATQLLKELPWKRTEYQKYLELLMLCYYANQKFDNAIELLTQDAQYQKQRFIESADFMTNKQLETYWNTNKVYFDYYAILINYTNSFPQYTDKMACFAYDNELFRKGLLLFSASTIQNSILESNDPTLISQWQQLNAEQQLITALQEKHIQSQELEKHIHIADSLEKALVVSSSLIRENRNQWTLTWDSVQKYLSLNEVAIEFFTVPLNADSVAYYALFLRKDSRCPELVYLFEEHEALELIHSHTENQINNTYSYYENNNLADGYKLAQLVWSKILPKINDGQTIYFAPNGIFYQLAIESLPYDENKTYSDVYNIVRLSSTRQLALGKTPYENSYAALYGGIEYTLSSDTMLAQSKIYESYELNAKRNLDYNIDRGEVRKLDGTKKEVEKIKDMLEKNKIDVKLYTDINANEESFKVLSGANKNIIHIATHGFFWNDSTARQKEYFSQRVITLDDFDTQTQTTIDPLTRCGLLFAGANTALSGRASDIPNGVQDGVLTAKEISLLDLRKANLVVLSACETGKGDITSEGVFGLQRAFKQAGVQTIIMSLWPVNDYATQFLMTEFYHNWITKQQTKHEAFKNAQNATKEKYEDPIYWAGFIMLD